MLFILRSQIEELDRLLADIKTNELSKNVKNLKEAQLELIKQFRALQTEQNKVDLSFLFNYTVFILFDFLLF